MGGFGKIFKSRRIRRRHVEITGPAAGDLLINEQRLKVVGVDAPGQRVPEAFTNRAGDSPDRIFEDPVEVDRGDTTTSPAGELEFLEKVRKKIGAGHLEDLAIGGDERNPRIAPPPTGDPVFASASNACRRR